MPVLTNFRADSVDVVLDPVRGRDHFPGTALKPKRTGTAAQGQAGPGGTVGVPAGADVRETLDWSAIAAPNLEGVGALYSEGFPKFDGADDLPISAWQTSLDRDDAFDKVYSQPWKTDNIRPGQDSLGVIVVQDGIPMPRAASVLDCFQTPNSHVVTTLDGTIIDNRNLSDTENVIVYVHPKGSTDPRNNARQYKAIRRGWVVRIGDGGTARKVFALRPGDDNGALNGGFDILFDQVVTADAVVHEQLAASGTFQRFVSLHTWDEPTIYFLNRMAEFFTPDGTGRRGRWDTGIMIGPGRVRGTTLRGLGGHSSDSATPYQRWLVRDCTLWDCDVEGYAVDAMRTLRLRIDGGMFDLPLQPSNAGPALPNATAFIFDTWINGYANAGNTSQLDRFFNINDDATVLIDGLRLESSQDKQIWFFASATGLDITLRDSVVFDNTAQVSRRIFAFGDFDAADVSGVYAQRGPDAANTAFLVHSTASVAVDSNAINPAYSTTVRQFNNATQYTNLAALQAAGFDLDSIDTPISMVDPANGDFAPVSALSNGAGLNRPEAQFIDDKPSTPKEAQTWVLNR